MAPMMVMDLVQPTEMSLEYLRDEWMEMSLVVLMEKGLAHLMVSGLVQPTVKCLEKPTEMPKELRLGSLLDDLMVTLMVMMMEMHSAHLTAHQLVQLLEILANIVFCPHHLSETNNIVQCHNFL